MEIDNMQVVLSANATSFNTAIDTAKGKLTQFALEEKSLKAQEDVLQRSLADNANKIDIYGQRCQTTTQKIEEKNQKIQQASQKYGENSTQVLKLQGQLAKLNLQLDKQTTSYNKAVEKSNTLNSQLIDVQNKEKNLATQVQHTNATLDQQQKEFAETAQQGAGMGNQLQGAFLMLKGLAVGYAGKTLFNALIGSNADYEQSMTSFEVLLQSADKANTLMNDMTTFAAKTPFEMSDVTKNTQTLLTFGTAQEDVINRLRQLGDLSQGVPDKLERITLAYGKMNAKGKVSLEELNMLTEAGVPILKQLAEQSGVTQEQLFKNITDGKLGVDDINQAITVMTSKGGQFFGMMEKQSANIKGLWSTLSDDINIFAKETGKEAFAALKTELADVLGQIDKMSDNGQLSSAAKEWGQNIAHFVSGAISLVETLYKMRSVIIGAGGAWVTFKVLSTVIPVIQTTTGVIKLMSNAVAAGATKQELSNLIDGKTVLVKNSVTGAVTIQTAAVAKEAIALDGATYSQLGFNSALLANPYTWVAIGIGALITGLIGYNQHLDNARQAQAQARQEASQMASEYGEQSKSIDDLANRYTELSKQTNLNESAKQELKSIQEQLNGLFGEEAKGLDVANGKYDENIAKIKEMSKTKAEAFITENYGNYSNAKKDMSNDIVSEKSKDGSAFDVKGKLTYLVSLYDDEINKLKEIEKQNGKLTFAEQKRLDIATEKYKEFKTQLGENTSTIAIYTSALVRNGEMTEEQAKSEVKALTGSTASWDNLTNSVNSKADAVQTGAKSEAKAIEQANASMKASQENITTLQGALSQLNDGKKINADTLSTLIDKYPDLVTCLGDEKAMHDAIIAKEKQERDNYSEALTDKLLLNTDFVNSVLTDNENLINKIIQGNGNLTSALANAYGVDKNNFSNIADIKREIDTLLISNLGENWSNFYGNQAEALRGFVDVATKVSANTGLALSPELTDKVTKAQALIGTLENVARVKASYVPKTVSFGDDKKDSTKKDTSKSDAEKAAQEAEKVAQEAEKAEQERIKGEFEFADRFRQMNWISEEQYWEEVTALRDKYYTKDTDDWWAWTLKIQKHNEDLHKQMLDDTKKSYSDYLSASQSYIDKCSANGWGTDNEVDAYKRRGDRIRQYQQELIGNEQLTADERNELWSEANEDLYQNDQKLKKVLLSQSQDKQELSLSYVNDKAHFNDWGADSPEQAFERVKERNIQDLQHGIITEKEYNKNLSDVGTALYDNRVEQSKKWLEQQRKYNDMSNADYVAGLERIKEYTQLYYDQGIISYRQYADTIQDINNNIFDGQAQLYDDILKSKSDNINDLKEQYNNLYSSIQDKWKTDDRLVSMDETMAKMSEFEGAVTGGGQEEYKRLQQQLKQLEREDELFKLQQKNNATLSDMEKQYKELETNKLQNIKDLSNMVGTLVSQVQKIPEKVGQIYNQVTNNNYTNAPTVTQNNTVVDKTGLGILGRFITSHLKY